MCQVQLELHFGPSWSQVGTKLGQVGAKLGQVGGKRGRIWDMMVENGGQDGQDRQRCSQMELKRAKIGQHRPKIAEKSTNEAQMFEDLERGGGRTGPRNPF